MTEVTRDCSCAPDPATFIQRLERVRRIWKVSVRSVLMRLNSVSRLPPDFLVVLLSWIPHMKSGQDPALRVSGYFPKPTNGWFVPPNQRAESIGFRGACILHQWWIEFPSRIPGNHYRRAAVFGIQISNGQTTITENSAPGPEGYLESLRLWARPNSSLPWSQFTVSIPVTYRFYASDELHAYCMAVADTKMAKESNCEPNRNSQGTHIP